MKQPLFTVMYGLPRSGKTTWVARNKKKDDIVISSDEIRKEIFPDFILQKNKQTSNLVSLKKLAWKKRRMVIIGFLKIMKVLNSEILENSLGSADQHSNN
jgi:predicted kinase